MKRYRHYNKERAIVLSCFGSVIEQEKYFEFKEYIEAEFEGIDVFISFSSRMVIKALEQENQNYKNLVQTLADVDMLGYKTIVVSSVNLFPTDEHDMAQNIVDGFKLFSPSNIALSKAILTKSKESTLFLKELNDAINIEDVANLFVIHGTPQLTFAGIASIEYASNFLSRINSKSIFCSLEGTYPYFSMKDIIVKELKEKNIKSLQVIPLLLVSGNHFENDMLEIKNDMQNYFETSLVKSVTKSDKFNLLEFTSIKQIIRVNIEEEFIKLGQKF